MDRRSFLKAFALTPLAAGAALAAPPAPAESKPYRVWANNVEVTDLCGPVKVARFNASAAGLYPSPSEERRLLELLAKAETDPRAWLITNYRVEYEELRPSCR
jgi:hypothetical protein